MLKFFETGSKTRGRWAEIFWPSVDDLGSAQRVARQGVRATFALFGISIVLTVATVIYGGTAGVVLAMSIWVCLLALFAFGIWMMWRPLAVLALLSYVGVTIYFLLGGSGAAIPMLMITLALGNSVRGTFAYSRLARARARITGAVEAGRPTTR